MRREVLVLTAASILTACSEPPWGPRLTPEQLAEKDRQAAAEQVRQQQAHAQQVVAAYSPFCTELGLQPGSVEFADCVIRLMQQDQSLRLNARPAEQQIDPSVPGTILSNAISQELNHP